jgi:hypothetical protein
MVGKNFLKVIRIFAFNLVELTDNVGSLHLPQLRLTHWCYYRSLHAQRVLDPASHIRPISKSFYQPSKFAFQSTRYVVNKTARTFSC